MIKSPKHNKLISSISMLVMGSFSALAVIVSTIAWYSDANNFTPTNVKSSVITNYFHAGDGSQANPFVITRPIHYYNMVYLHQNNEYKVENSTFADAGFHFQFGEIGLDASHPNTPMFYEYNDAGELVKEGGQEKLSTSLNLNYYAGTKAMIPLGTSLHPFKGHVDGQNLTILKLHIDGTDQSDVGIFGVVANGATVKNVYYENPIINTNNVNTTALSDASHTQHIGTAYVGYLAGHVHDDNQFENVYLNNPTLQNTVANTSKQSNHTGYFGHIDVKDATMTGTKETYSSTMDATAAYKAINDTYEDGAPKSVTTRNTDYTPTGTYGDAMQKEGTTPPNNYSSKQFGEKPYSLSTIGYESGGTITEHVRYKKDGFAQHLSTSTVELPSKPTTEEWGTKDDGYYLYWDDMLGKWQYTSVVSPQSEIVTTVKFKCMTISYLVAETRHYCYYKNGVLEQTTIAPDDPSVTAEAKKDYYFVFKTSANSTGLASLIEGGEIGNYYIYSPNNKSYLTATATTTVTPANFVSSFDQAMLFTIAGPQTSIAYQAGAVGGALLGYETSLGGRKSVSTVPQTSFDIGTVQERHSDNGSQYDLITADNINDPVAGITDGCTLAIGAIKIDKTTNAVEHTSALSTVQNKNNRGAVFTNIVNNQLEYVPNMARLRTNVTLAADGTTKHYTFYDIANDGWLYAAGLAPSGKNHLRTENPLNSYGTDYGVWTITIDTSNLAHIKSVGNARTPYLRYNASSNGQAYYTFACYNHEAVTTTVTPQIFKKNDNTGDLEHYSDAVELEFSTTTSTEKIITHYDLYTAPLSVNDANDITNYDGAPFKTARTSSNIVTFNFTDSKVTYTKIAEKYWQRIKSESELQAGDEIIFASDKRGSVLALPETTTPQPLDLFVMSTNQLTNNRGAITNSIKSEKIGAKQIIKESVVQNVSNPKIQVVTLEQGLNGINMNWSFNVGSGYLYADGVTSGKTTNNYLKTTNGLTINDAQQKAEASATITIDTYGDAIVQFQGGNDSIYLRYNCHGTNNFFSSYTLDSNCQTKIQIYKHVKEKLDETTYIGDYVGSGYDCDVMDVVGPATYTPNTVELSGSINNSKPLKEADINTNFYTTSHLVNALTIKVDVTGSRDLGTLRFKCQGAMPYFASGISGNNISFTDAHAKDLDTNPNDDIHEYVIHLNTENIKRLSYCAIKTTADVNPVDQISAVYNNAGVKQFPVTSEPVIDKYVIAIGNINQTLKITSASFKFTKLEGNIGTSAKVDYRSAHYNKNGNFNGQNNQVTMSHLSIYYDLDIIDEDSKTFSIIVHYDKANKTYNVTITSSKLIRVNIFNYDANEYNLIVNGVKYYEGSNEIIVLPTAPASS